MLTKQGTDLALTWAPACSPTGTDYAVYEGLVGDFTSHAPVACTTAGARAWTLHPGSGSRYHLVVPLDASSEGSYGHATGGAQRPPATSACRPQLLGACP